MRFQARLGLGAGVEQFAAIADIFRGVSSLTCSIWRSLNPVGIFYREWLATHGLKPACRAGFKPSLFRRRPRVRLLPVKANGSTVAMLYAGLDTGAARTQDYAGREMSALNELSGN